MAPKKALIIGSTGGIGQAVTREFLKYDIDVWLLARDTHKAAQLFPEISDKQIFKINENPDEHFIETIVKEFQSQKIQFDIGCNLAGSGIFQSVRKTHKDTWDSIYKDNLEIAFIFTRIFLATAREKNFEILFLGSAGTNQAWPKNAMYGSMKAATEYFAKSLQKEVASQGGRIWLVKPGSVNTPFFDQAPKHLPREKMLQPDEIGRLMVDQILNTPKGVFIPEQTLLSDPFSA